MTKSNILNGACAAAIALMLPLSAASAASATQTAYTPGNPAVFNGTQESLVDAVRKIEHATGGNVAEIRFDASSGAPSYAAAIVKNNRIQFLRLDAQSGRLTPVAAGSEPGWMTKLRDIDVTRFDYDAKIPLSQAILNAENTDRNAVAVAAGMGQPNRAIHAYNVLIARDGAAHRVAIDNQNGEAIADANALGPWP